MNLNRSELKVLKLMAEGRTNEQIVQALRLTSADLAFHIRRISFVLNEHSEDEQVGDLVIAINHGLTDRCRMAA